MPFFGFMPFLQLYAGRVVPVPRGRSWCWPAVLLLVVVLSWWGLEATRMGAAGVSNNKAYAAVFWIRWFDALLLSPAGHGGEGSRCGGVKTCRSGRERGNLLQLGDTHMVALFAAMIHGRWNGLSSVPSKRRLFNLLWRPFFNGSALELLFLSIPSGRFPGDGEEGRWCDPFLRCGGARRSGLYCVFSFSSRVFLAYLEDQVVIFLLCVFLYVKPTV